MDVLVVEVAEGAVVEVVEVGDGAVVEVARLPSKGSSWNFTDCPSVEGPASELPIPRPTITNTTNTATRTATAAKRERPPFGELPSPGAGLRRLPDEERGLSSWYLSTRRSTGAPSWEDRRLSSPSMPNRP
jgi:hypothetical protein